MGACYCSKNASLSAQYFAPSRLAIIKLHAQTHTLMQHRADGTGAKNVFFLLLFFSLCYIAADEIDILDGEQRSQ